MVDDANDTEIEFTETIDSTVIKAVSVNEPSTVVAVIVAEPTPTAVTKPEELTVNTLSSEELQFTFLLVALAGDNVAVNCCVLPMPEIDDVSGVIDMPVTG
jgi:hypothetical protein